MAHRLRRPGLHPKGLSRFASQAKPLVPCAEAVMGRRAGVNHRYRPVAGCRHHNGELRVIVSFDDDTFAEVNEGARLNDCSFSSQVRMLIEVGLETLKQAGCR